MKEEYKELLDRAFKEFETFSLVWRDQLNFKKSATEMEKTLKPYLINTKKTSEWPGTKLLAGGMATINHYKVTAESLNILKTVDSVFEWLAPVYPEDLTFYKKGKPVYISIAHEKDAWYERT